MTSVVRFPREKRSKPIRTYRKSLRKGIFGRQVPTGSMGLADLGGYKPLGHPKIEYGPRGKVLLAEKQVWVEEDNSLWIIRSLETKNKGKRNQRVIVYLGRYYYGPYVSLVLSESRFRRIMKIWEQAFEEWLEECASLGIDPETGDRLE